MKKLGLALGGGGLKGLAHIGVLQVLEKNGIRPQVLSGTSVGSIVAALYGSGMTPDEMAANILKLTPRDYLDYNISGLIKYVIGLFIPGDQHPMDGIIKGQRLEDLIFQWTGGQTLHDVKMPLAIISCDLNSGQEVVFSNRPIPSRYFPVVLVRSALLSVAVRCSTSIPATFVPRSFRNMRMADGGLRNMVPVSMQPPLGAEYILAVDLGQEIYQGPVDGIPAIINRSMNILTYENSEKAENLIADMIIYPNIPSVNLDDLSQAQAIILKGQHAMEARLDELIAALSA